MELDFYSIYEQYDKYYEIYLKYIDSAFKLLKLKFDPIISVSLIDDEKIHDINKQYRNIDKSTDVISFAFMDNEDVDLKKAKGPIVLGDIYISIDHAKAQANEYKHSEEREFSFLFVHGLLHLLGYDHMKKEDEDIMFPLQEEILNATK